MTSARELQAILRVSTLRCDAQARRCSAADAAVREAEVALEAAHADCRSVEAEIAALTAAARNAFLSAPQTSHAVLRMLGESRSQNEKVEAAAAAVDAAAEVLQSAQNAAKAEWDKRRDLERAAQKRSQAASDLLAKERRRAEVQLEDSQAEEQSRRVVS